jgi:hypothetical protein
VDTLDLEVRNQGEGLITQVQESSPLFTEYYKSVISVIRGLVSSFTENEILAHVFLGGRFQHCGGVGEVHSRQSCWLV